MTPSGIPTINGFTDSFTGALVTLNGDHHYIHSGKAYMVPRREASVAAAASINAVLTTPATSGDSTDKYIHYRPEVITSSASGVRIELYEGSTTTGGSAITPQQMNRNYTNTSVVTVVHGATISSAGTLLASVAIGSTGTPTQRSGGASGDTKEFVLKPGTKYSIVITNIGSGATDIDYNLFWYEEDYGL